MKRRPMAKSIPMIRRLRLQFVAVCMALVTSVVGVVVIAAFFSAQKNIEMVSRSVLQRVIQETPGLVGSRPVRPDLGMNIGGDYVLLPYFTVNVWSSNDGYNVYVTGGTYDDLENTEELAAILQDCLNQNQAEGTISSYSLRYLRQDNGLYQKIAFVDMSMEKATVQELMGSHLRIAGSALIVLLGISLLLSHWVTRPVEKAWRQQRQFLSDASHELKTPLTVILSNAEMLESTPLTDHAARWRDNIHSEARRMRTLVEQMLILARADNMACVAERSEVILSDVAADCALAFEAVAFEAGKTMLYNICPDIRVSGDREKLRQIVSILLDNAIKYSSKGSDIILALEKEEHSARLMVTNFGEPIPPQQLSHLFERFYRADASRGEQSGFGLGLSIAAMIAQEHQASLKAESDHLSTRFIFTIPLQK